MTFRCMLEVHRILGRDIGSLTLRQWPYCLPAVMSALQSPAGMGSIRTVGAPGDLPAGQGLSGANRDCTLQNSGLELPEHPYFAFRFPAIMLRLDGGGL